MHTVQDIVEEAKRLPPADRRRLVEELKETLPEEVDAAATAKRRGALDRFIALAGASHAAYSDVATDKYKHLAEIYAERAEGEK